MARAVPILIVTAAVALAGCSGMQKTVGGWFGDVPATSTQDGTVYFAATDGLAVHGDASFSSPVVGRLALHEKIVRTRLQSGFAYVVSDQTGVAGWVDNAQLIWRLPTAPQAGTVAAPADPSPAAAPTDVAPPAAAAAPEAAPAPAADTAQTPPPAATDAAPAPAATAPAADPAPEAAVAPAVAPAAAPASKRATPEIFDPF